MSSPRKVTMSNTMTVSHSNSQSLATTTPREKRPIKRVDNHNDATAPLDFSFQNVDTLETFETLLTNYLNAKPLKGKVTGLKLSYNDLTTITGLQAILEARIPGISESLLWLDLSHNKLTHIEDDILAFPNISFLTLDGNNIQSVVEVKKLKVLTSLTKFAIFGNNWLEDPIINGKRTSVPVRTGLEEGNTHSHFIASEQGGLTYVTKQMKRIESNKFYRQRLVYYLRNTKLKILDNILVSKQDREGALAWATVYLNTPKKPAEEKQEVIY